jgi:hypothetical protein
VRILFEKGESMKCHRVSVCASIVGLLAYLVVAGTASAKTAKLVANAGDKAQMIGTLESAHRLLASADHDYDGRRAKAMEEIKKAIHELGGGKEKTVAATAMVKEPRMKVAKAHVKESQAASDAKLREALSMISGVGSGMGSHHKAAGHVSAAVGHLNAALHIR